MNKEKFLFGSNNSVNVEINHHRKLVLVGSIKEVSYTLRILRGLLEGKILASVSEAEFIRAMRMVAKLKALKAENDARRRLCGK